MSRRENACLRCPRCRMLGSLCVCPLIPNLVTRTRLLLVIHRIEARKPTNTGRLAAECIAGSRVIVRGEMVHCNEPLPFEAGTQPVLLFPHEEAIPLARFASSPKPITLVVPDGTWRQAFKVRNRIPGLHDIPCVSLPHDAPSIYRLRAEAHAHGLATMEAIARAMGILEGIPVRRALEHVFRVMVERSLWARGELNRTEVTGGIPAALSDLSPAHAPRDLSSL